MSCNCQMSGTKLPYRTPGAYLSAAKALPAGPARERAMRSAALAFATAAAAERGDMRLVRSGMRGLGMLGVAGGDDSPATKAQVESNLTSLRGDANLIAAMRAAGVPEDTIRVVAVVREVINGVVGGVDLVVNFIPDEGAKMALRWVAFLLTARNPPGISDNDVRVLADICQGSAFLDNQATVDRTTLELADAIGSLFGAEAAKKAHDVVSVIIAFLKVFRARLCASRLIVAELNRRRGPGDAAITEEAMRVAQEASARATAVPTPQELVRRTFRTALFNRWTFENLGPSITTIPWGGRRLTRGEFDCLTSRELLAASQAFVSTFPGTPLTPLGRVRITVPQGYVNTPPSASCPPPGSGGGGGGGGGGASSGGGGGGGVAAAAAGAGLIAWLFFR